MNPSRSEATYPNMKRRYQYCDTCGSLLPAPGYYCIKCDPPELPEPDPDHHLGFFQTFFRITLLVIIFIVIIVYKLDIEIPNYFERLETDSSQLKMAQDDDFKLSYKVNVSFANLRDQPNSKTSTILFVLAGGTQVEILDTKGKWSKIRTKPMPGKKARVGWLASKLIDSEIK